MSTTREPFDPFLSKLSVPAEGKATTPIDEIKTRIKQSTKDYIEETKTALDSAKKWEEGIKDGFAQLTRSVDELLGGDQITTKSPSEILSSEKCKELLAIAKGVGADASRVSHNFPSSKTTTFSPSLTSEDVLKESTVHEEELQHKAEEITAEDPGIQFLQVSYEDLETRLQECLLCFSAFPVNRVIKRRVMIYWWIGEGLVTPTRDGRTAEQVGKDYFKMLIASGLIEPIYQKHSKAAKYCKIDTWVRQMLVSKAKESGFFAFDPEDRLIFDSSKSKRACLMEMKEKDQVEISPESNPNGLHSLFNLSVQYLRCEKGKDQLAKLKSVSALQLGRWQNSSRHHIEVADTKFLDGLESLEELRYLSLQGISRITELPETIDGLNNLLILDLRLCHNLENVTPAVTRIESLTHLDVSECYLLDKMPPGIGSMTNLQVLKGFVVGGTRSTNPCQLSELTHLKKLRKLSIRIGSGADIDKDLGELSKIERLRSLKITWGSIKSPQSKITRRKSSKTGTMKESEAQSFSHQHLEKLVLECVPADNSVSWLKPGGFKELKRLYIAGGKLSQRSLVRENDEWNVEILRLKFLKELNFEWDDLKRKLPRLRCAQIYKCPENGPSLRGFDEKGFWVWNEVEASSSSMDGTSAPVRMRNEEEASTSSMGGTSAPVRMRNKEEASTSTMAGTSAPVRMRNEEEAGSSSMAGTTAPLRTRNEEEASSSSMAETTAPIRMRNEEEASSSSMAGTSAPVAQDDLDS